MSEVGYMAHRQKMLHTPELGYFLGLLMEGSPHAKVCYDIEIFLLFFPKEKL